MVINSALHFSVDSRANNLGTFLLGFSAIVSLFSFYRWKKEKLLEKRKDIAENISNSIDSSEVEIDCWITRMLFTYKQRQNEETNKPNEFEESIYTQNLLINIKMLKITKNYALRLFNPTLNKAIDDLIKFIKELISNLQSYHFETFESNEMKKKAKDNFDKAPDKLEKLCKTIRNELKQYHMYN